MTWRAAFLLLGLAAGLQGATQYFAWLYRFDAALGPGLGLTWGLGPDVALYPPWSILIWAKRHAAEAGPALSRAGGLVLLGLAGGLLLATRPARRPARRRGWGGLAEARRAGLLNGRGVVVGSLRGRLLTSDDLRPTLVTGGTRSGKGRGHVAPTLLSWTDSVLVHDPKSELWTLTAGWRAGFSHVMRLDPRDPASARWNPLAEIRPGPGELAQVQRLVAILSDPGGARDEEAIWDKAASEILEAVILHVLHVAEDADKTLLKVRELLADLDRSAETMRRTLHFRGEDGAPRTHPFILTAVTGYAAMHDRFRTSVQGTARSYLKWLAGEDLEHVLSASDFAMGDLMCAEAPVSLYIQVAPADAAALRPFVRLLFHAAAQSLTAREREDAAGRPKRRPLLMLMDEFPLLGRLAFFEKALRLLSGYGVKTLFVAQSLNDIVETYGVHNTLLDNCAVYTAFSALDPVTQEKVSRLTGSVTEVRTSRSAPAGLSAGRASVSRGEVERPLLEPGEVRALPDEEQLVFVAGRKPLRTRKIRYDHREPFRSRARLVAPDQARGLDAPPPPPHPWAGRRSLGRDGGAALPLFKEVAGAIDERKAAEQAARAYDRILREMSAQEAALDQLQGGGA
ncbi:type IV secretory system conjugative DNA transfer family protein [Brevundimonas sp. CEF1]|uniref:type IV secretory system conjugative DNA transfer family protein n=1 Tax=Brevundimonas sp. CEF1 TaxID=3442642 RepID=UPI003F51A0F8